MTSAATTNDVLPVTTAAYGPALGPHRLDDREGVSAGVSTDPHSRESRRIADGHRGRDGVSDACQITAAPN